MNIEQLTQQIIKPFLLEEEGIKIGLIGGSFRPPHKGHFELIKKAAGENTHVFIIASDSDTADQDRNFSSEISEKIWDIYLTKLPNVKYINAQVPVSVVYEIVNILNNDKYTISPNKKTGVIKPASPISEEIASQIKKLGTKFNINVYVGDAADTKSYKQFTDMPERYTNKNVTNVKINTMGRVEGLKAEYLRVALQNGEFDRISDFLPTELNPNEKEQSIELMKKGRLAEMYWPQVSNIKSSDGKNPILDLVLELNPEALKYFRENTGAEIFLTFSGETAIKVKRIGTALGGKVQLDIINRGSVPTDKPEQVIEIKDDNYDKWLEKFYSNNNWIKSMLNTVNESVIIEGGNAFVGTQRINKADIKPTIEWLEGLTKLPLSNNMIGSTGIKDSSSDLDLAVDINTTSKEQLYTTLFNWCVTNDLNPKENVKKSGVSVHFKTPINGDIQYGFVQTDFMFNSDTEFFKFALVAHSSKYSGKDRQVVLSNLAKAAGCKWSSANGLTDRITNEPIPGGKDPIQIAKKLLGKDTAVPEDLHTIESIIAALEGDPKKGERLGNFQKDDVLLEGGSGGHIQHPYDAAKTGTGLIKLFNDVVSYINDELKEKPSIKIDGINAAVRYVNKEFVLDRGSAKPLDVSGIRTQDLVNRFGDGHGFIKIGEIVLKILNSANKDIQPELKKLGLLDNPKLMLNMEYVAGKTNVKDYGKNFLAIHNMLSIDFVPGAKRREAVTVDYDKSAMDSLINKVNIKAAEQQFEMTGKISAQFKSQPNLSGVLSQTINLKGNKDKPKSLSEHLNSLQIPTSKDIVEFADGTKAGALSGKVFNKILENKESLTVIFKDNNSIKLAISGFISVYATMVLGEEILKNLDSKLGAANEQEGIVIQGLLPLPLKITGKFIIDKNLTTFSK